MSLSVSADVKASVHLSVLYSVCRAVGRGAGGWPAALAGLLGTAPQCIPFEHRLLVFRALVDADKERYVTSISVQSNSDGTTAFDTEDLA